MRTPLVRAAAVGALLCVPSGLDAQVEPLAPLQRVAFPRAWAAWVGIAGFGTRAESDGTGTALRGEYGYKSSLAAGASYEMPLTRRLGLYAGASVAPLADQRGDLANSVATFDNRVVFGGDVGLAARFKPTAPVFFVLGGGVTAATGYAVPGSEGSPVEPHGTFLVGYDAKPTDRSSLRLVFASHFASPADPELSGVSASGVAYDWAVHVGLRVRTGDVERRP